MALCFLFAEQLDESGCLCLRLEPDGMLSALPQHRSFAEIKSLQHNAETIVVLSSALCGFYRLELPWLNDTKARQAIPFALEEQLAQKVSTLHFSFDKSHFADNHYLVVVVDKAYLVDLMSALDSAEVHFNAITVDWFALQNNEVCVGASSVLCNRADYQGALAGAVTEGYLAEVEDVLYFSDSLIQKDADVSTQSFYVWAAERLMHASYINLCQGELSHGLPQENVRFFWGRMSFCAFAAWLVVGLLMNTVNLWRLNHATAEVDKSIERIYKQFFPEATRVISPRFRIEQLLNTGGAAADALIFWRIYDKFAKVFDDNEMTLTRLTFKTPTLTLNLTAPDFGALDGLNSKLKGQNLKVTQSAISHEHHVSADLELRL